MGKEEIELRPLPPATNDDAAAKRLREFFAGAVRDEVKPGLDSIRGDLHALFPALANQDKPLPTSEVFGEYLEVQRARRERRVVDRLENALRPVIDGLGVDDLREADARGIESTLLRLRRERRWCAATYEKRRLLLSALFSFLVKQDRLLHNPVQRVPRARIMPKPIRFLTRDEMTALFRVTDADPWIGPAVRVAIFTGCRRGELVGLTWNDVNFETGRIHVRATKTKTLRAVKIHAELRPLLDELYAARGNCPFVLESPKRQGWDGQNLVHRLVERERAAGLPRWTFLDFRHTFASLLAMRGASLFVIAKLLGNTPEICRTHYAHLTNESLDPHVDF